MGGHGYVDPDQEDEKIDRYMRAMTGSRSSGKYSAQERERVPTNAAATGRLESDGRVTTRQRQPLQQDQPQPVQQPRGRPGQIVVFELTDEERERQRHIEEEIQYEWDQEEDRDEEARSPITLPPRSRPPSSGRLDHDLRLAGRDAAYDRSLAGDRPEGLHAGLSVKQHLEALTKQMKTESSATGAASNPHQQRLTRKLALLTEDLRAKNNELLALVREASGAPPLAQGSTGVDVSATDGAGAGAGRATGGDSAVGGSEVGSGGDADILLRVIEEKNKEIKTLKTKLEAASAVSNQTSHKVEELTKQMARQAVEMEKMKAMVFGRMIDGQGSPGGPSSDGSGARDHGGGGGGGPYDGPEEDDASSSGESGAVDQQAPPQRIPKQQQVAAPQHPSQRRQQYPQEQQQPQQQRAMAPQSVARARDYDARQRAPQFPLPIENARKYSDQNLGRDGRYLSAEELGGRQGQRAQDRHAHGIGHLRQTEQASEWHSGAIRELGGDAVGGPSDIAAMLRQSADTYCRAMAGQFEQEVDTELRRARENEEVELKLAMLPVTIYPPDTLKHPVPDFSPVKRTPAKDATWFDMQLDDTIRSTRRKEMEDNWPGRK